MSARNSASECYRVCVCQSRGVKLICRVLVKVVVVVMVVVVVVVVFVVVAVVVIVTVVVIVAADIKAAELSIFGSPMPFF